MIKYFTGPFNSFINVAEAPCGLYNEVDYFASEGIVYFHAPFLGERPGWTAIDIIIN